MRVEKLYHKHPAHLVLLAAVVRVGSARATSNFSMELICMHNYACISHSDMHIQQCYALVWGGSSTSNLLEPSSTTHIAEIAMCVVFFHMSSGWFN